jgi:cardiolipin synthase
VLLTGFDFGLVGGWIVTSVEFLLRIIAIIWIPRNRRPQTAAAWLLAILFIPELGWLAFWLFGSRRVGRGRRARLAEVNRYIRESMRDEFRSERAAWPPWLPGVVRLNRSLGAMPIVAGNSAAFLPDYDEALTAMTAAVGDAKRIVHAEFYILILDRTTQPFFDALAAAAARGVTVRVLLDHVANLRLPGFRRTKRFLRDHGIRWELMLPLQPYRLKWQRPDLRNHRKLLVIDGEVAFTGSQNLIDASYNKLGNRRRGLRWKDLMVRCEGPIVGGIDALFITDWYSETGELLTGETPPQERVTDTAGIEAQVVPSGPGFADENNLRLFNSLVYAAQRHLVICSPYFVPDDSMLYAITTAAQSGVEVELFVSEVGDQFMVFHAQRSYYETLLAAGVRIWLYEAPTILHAKHVTVDDEVAVFGSSNLDMRSFSLNYELSILVRSPELVAQLRDIEQDYRAHSRELTLDAWLARNALSQVFDNVMRLTAGLQ